MAPEGQEEHPFLTPDRIDRAGAISAELLLSDLSWIERRKDAIEILDDTALRRRISVDFSLRTTVDALLKGDEYPSGSEPLFCAPVFVLAKSPANLMEFDLEDEAGKSLRLQSRTDNAAISAATIAACARAVLGAAEDLEPKLEEELRRVATADAVLGKRRADDLLNVRKVADTSQLHRLRTHPRFRQWLSTFGHSSLCVVLYRAPHHNRKLIRLSFTAPIATEQPWQARLGWIPYRLVLDIPLLEARTFHFEATSPAGLRVKDAALSDAERKRPIEEDGLRRRIHLYRAGAQQSGAGTAVLRLVVGGPGFLGGAVLASALTLIALIFCAIFAENIEASPNSAPSLLLVLPGLIASYVARPDQHALTSRLLSGARYLLLVSAGCAYVAAGRVALAGARSPTDDSSSLMWMLIGLAFVAAAVTGALVWTRMRADDQVRRCNRWLDDRRGWETEQTLTMPGVSLAEVRLVFANDGDAVAPPGYRSIRDARHPHEPSRFVALTTFGTWFVEYEIAELWNGCRVE